MEIVEQDVFYIVILFGCVIVFQQIGICLQVGGEIFEMVYDFVILVKIGDVLFCIDFEMLVVVFVVVEVWVVGVEVSLMQVQNIVICYCWLEGLGVFVVDRVNVEVVLKQVEVDLVVVCVECDVVQFLLDRMCIVSFIDGMVDVVQVLVGDLVMVGQLDVLMIIIQFDLIYVDVSEFLVWILCNCVQVSVG